MRSPANSALNVQTVESFSANGAFACQSIADSRLLKSRDASEHARRQRLTTITSVVALVLIRVRPSNELVE